MTENCNCTFTGWTLTCTSNHFQAAFYVLCATYVISLILNITCMFIYSSGKKQQRNRERKLLREMEDNPIYENPEHMETNAVLFDENQPIQVSLSSLSSNNPQEVGSDSQDCYANLHVKAKKQNKRRPPRNQDPGVVHLEEPESIREGNGDSVNTNAVVAVSDLYASVNNHRSHAAIGKEFANHL
ncbi:uncharacterized protein LOC144992211 [Oryzias latipes]